MRLADFIEAHVEDILTEWEAFARTLLPAAEGMDVLALRDHASQILYTAAADLRTNQSESEQIAKSREQASSAPNHTDTAAETHGILLATRGFTLEQLVAEYRALRASVLKLWAQKCPPDRDTLVDMVRFNEAIDQAVAESIQFFARETEHWRNMFVGILAHDLRGPLNAMLLTAELVLHLNRGSPAQDAALRLMRSGDRLRQLLDDVLDFSHASLSQGIPITPTATDLAVACIEEVELQKLAWPGRPITFVVEGSTQGTWDVSRLKQVLANLICNAAKYGHPGTPINVRLLDKGQAVELAVENFGNEIDPSQVQLLFEPLRRGTRGDAKLDRSSLGLGLFIVRQIARAHGGSIAVTSSNTRTVFSVILPKTHTQQAAA